LTVLVLRPPMLRLGERRCFDEGEDCCFGGPGRPIVPAVLLAVASELKRRGFDVAFIDLSLEKNPYETLEDSGLDAVLDRYNPDTVITSTTIFFKEQLTFISKALKERGIEHVTISVPEGYHEDLEGFADFVAYSEPEHTIPDYLQGYAGEQPYPALFDHVKAIDYSIYPSRYNAVPGKVWVVQASRGCRYSCNFCVWGGSTLKRHPMRYKNPAVLVNELKQVSERRNVNDYCYVLTSQLTSDLRWLQWFSKLKEKACPELTFQADIGVGELTDENVALLKRLNLGNVTVGAEALDDRWLMRMNKPWRAESIQRGLRLLEKYEVPYHIILRYGAGETAKEVEQSIRNIRALAKDGIKPDYVKLGPLVAYKGTRLVDVLGGDVELNDLGFPVSSRTPLDALKRLTSALQEVGWT